MDSARRGELLGLMRKYQGVIKEAAFFTSFTHPPLPLAEIARRSKMLGEIMPVFRELGLSAGINHLSTIGHLDENLDNSLDEPWQKITDVNGIAAKGSYCPLDGRFRDYVREAYRSVAEARPDFIWIDDDVRLGHHPPAQFSCFCDLCLGRFAEETGREWTRESVAAAFNYTDVKLSRPLRVQWIEHNRRIINGLLTLIRSAVDEIDAQMPLGFMCCDMVYEGLDFAKWSGTLAGSNKVAVKWRPGGGFYTDARPLELLEKAHNMGRISAAIPNTDGDIQYEHENFPYQKLKKSGTIFAVESFAALAAGCTGVALNLMGISSDPFDEYLPYFDRIGGAKPLMDRLVATAGRSGPEGIWPAMTPDGFADFNAGRQWNGPGAVDPMKCVTELAEIGLPPAYSRAGAAIHLLTGAAVLGFDRGELEKLLSESVILDGPALEYLRQAGVEELAGFEVAGTRERDTIERFTGDALNGAFAGWWRDCRPSFWASESFELRPLHAESRVLAELIDFNGRVSGPVMGVHENRLGGRIAVVGYYPWKALQTLAKTNQMKNLCRWLSREQLAAYVSSFHKIALWCRRDSGGRLVVPFINASLDAVSDARMHVRADHPFLLMRLDGGEETVEVVARDNDYQVLNLPALGPWEMCLLLPE